MHSEFPLSTAQVTLSAESPLHQCDRVFLLDVPVAPLGRDGVLMEEFGAPGFVSSLSGFFPLSFLQHKLLLSGSHLVPIPDGAGHMLPQSVCQHTVGVTQTWPCIFCHMFFGHHIGKFRNN